jgi:UDP-galactopyranose mutase
MLYPSGLANQITEDLIARFGFDKSITLDQLLAVENGWHRLRELGNFISKNIFENYSQKAWGTDIFTLDPEIRKRVPIRINYDNRYFTDTFQCQPDKGFAHMVQEMLNHPNIKVTLKKSYSDLKVKCWTKKIYYTGMIDEFFNYSSGPLPYRDLKFIFRLKNSSVQDVATINYPDHHSITRITDFSFMDYSSTAAAKQSKKTWVVGEVPTEYDKDKPDAVPYYPVRSEASRALYRKYQEMIPSDMIFGGRLGRFEYLNMDQAVAQALHLAELELENDNQ